MAFIHTDLVQFFIAAERLRKKGLDGPAVVRYGSIVETASYEARPFGIKSGMSFYEAELLAAQQGLDLIVVESDREYYRQFSKHVMDILKENNNEMQIYSIDEAFQKIDDWDAAVELARLNHANILKETALHTTQGVAYSKYASKMTTKNYKPRYTGMSLTTMCQNNEEYARMFNHFDVDDLHDVGQATAEKLYAMGIRTIGELASADAWQLENIKPRLRRQLMDSARGDIIWEFVPWYIEQLSPPKSHGRSMGIPTYDRADKDRIKDHIYLVCLWVCDGLQANELSGRTVSVGARYSQFGGMDHTKRRTFNVYMNDDKRIINHASALYEKLANEKLQDERINRVEVRVSKLGKNVARHGEIL